MKSRTLIIIAIISFVFASMKIYSQTSLGHSDDLLLSKIYPQGKELSKEDEEKYLKKFSAEARVKLEEIKKLDKNKYYSLLRGGVFNFVSASHNVSTLVYDIARGNYNEQKKSTEELYVKQREAEIDVELAVLKYKKADAANQAKLRTEIYNALTKLFDIRESFKQEEIKELEKRLQDLKESLNTRKQNRDNIVSRRLKELLNEKDELRW